MIRQNGVGGWHAPAVDRYTDERLLQRVIADHPSLLPEVATSGVLSVKEFEVDGPGYVDVLCIDVDGGLTICECKLHTNSEMRRSIVGQLMGYAAALWQVPYDDFERRVDAHVPAGMVRRMEQLALEADRPDWDAAAFRATVEANLAEGRFRLVFAVDAITAELRRMVEFMNAHASADLDVLAVAIGYVRDGGVEILSPEVYGVELAESRGGGARRTRWDRTSFVAALEARSPEAAPGIKAFMAWADQERVSEVLGTGNDGSWYPLWHGRAMKDGPLSAWTSGSICVNLWYFRSKPGFDEDRFRAELERRVVASGVRFLPAKDSPGVSGADIGDPGVQPALFDVCQWVRGQFDSLSSIDPSKWSPLPGSGDTEGGPGR